MTSLTPDMQGVLERLEKLERQNRRLKRGGNRGKHGFSISGDEAVINSRTNPLLGRGQH
jgi:hypothetical protein